jgi:ferric-dicitrate binding protein FerR (iron transport regulator)
VSLTPCDRDWEAAAHREGQLGPKDVESFERHCRTCSACAEGLARDERLGALGRALPVDEPGELALKRLRARVLRDITTGSSSRSPFSSRRVLLVSLLGAALLTVAAIVRLSSIVGWGAPMNAPAARSPALLAGAVAPAEGAVWTQTRSGGVERIELEAGTLRVHVRPQSPSERFLVLLPDGEIEVRGTTFDVIAHDGTTRHVGVDEGTVVLRLRGVPELSLGPGARWEAQASSPADPPAAAVVDAASAPPATIPRRAPAGARDGDDGASVYVGAVRSLREGRYDAAAAAFHAFALAYPRATEAEDASFLEALSLARAGRIDAADLAAERHLESFPRSFHRREASILVARARGHRGLCGEALGILAPWMGTSPDAEVQSVLRACGGSAAAR